MSVRTYLLATAKEFSERDRNPVVAWDIIGAAAWARACRVFAKEVAGMSHDDGVKHLKARRKEIEKADYSDKPEKGQKAGKVEKDRLPGWFLQIDFSKRMDEIIDPIARDRKGWIEICTAGGLDDGKCSTRPGYRRMLGINRQVGWIGRERGESDAAWLKRRAEWLGQYHGGVKVARDNRWNPTTKDFELDVVATVREFLKTEHLAESR